MKYDAIWPFTMMSNNLQPPEKKLVILIHRFSTGWLLISQIFNTNSMKPGLPIILLGWFCTTQHKSMNISMKGITSVLPLLQTLNLMISIRSLLCQSILGMIQMTHVIPYAHCLDGDRLKWSQWLAFTLWCPYHIILIARKFMTWLQNSCNCHGGKCLKMVQNYPLCTRWKPQQYSMNFHAKQSWMSYGNQICQWVSLYMVMFENMVNEKMNYWWEW